MSSPQVSSSQVAKLVNVIPVGLKEAALDSPSFRASSTHFFEQIDAVERWLDGYVKTTGKLSSEVSTIESISSSLLSHLGAAPVNGSEAVLDHDYALLALKRYGDSAKDFWSGVVSTLREAENLVMEPVRGFINGELRSFKELRRTFEQSQKQYDHLQARFAGQAKTKEPSSLREDAFQLHEARKIYLKASMDFCVQSPHLKMALEKLLVHVSYDQWRELRVIRNRSTSTFDKFGSEMDRIRGWTHEIDSGEQSSRKELFAARKQIEEAAELAVRPSRELEDYAISTVPYLGSQGPASLKMADRPFGPEKQGWVSLRILTGKPTRAVWVRRWAFLQNGVFGCLVQGSRTGGVEESERIGVLLCSIRPAFQEERRFCFEVKTKSNSILLQTETQKELTEWIGTFESAKRRALETPQSEWSAPPLGQNPQTQDPAFSITQPPAPEFTADPFESLTPNAGDDQSTLERNATSLVDRDGLGVRGSADVRRSSAMDRDTDGARDHTSRIIHKLDIHRKSNASSQQNSSLSPQPGSSALSNLISNSNLTLPMPGGTMLENDSKDAAKSPYTSRGAVQFTLAPATLATPPMPTSMSRAAVIVSCDRGIGIGQSDSTGGVPSGMMANLWGSTHWGLINRLKREKLFQDTPESANDPTQAPVLSHATPQDPSSSQNRPRASHHRQTASLGGAHSVREENASQPPEYPPYYPQQLKVHDAQFCLLFPDVPRDETLVLVFRATFSPNGQQEFPGRAFATTRHLYFYSNCSGLVLTSSVDLNSISEVTAAPGRDCDFLFLHVIPEIGSDTSSRLTVKTFLEPLRLLQKRLNFLVKNTSSEQPADLETVIRSLQKMDTDGPTRSPSVASFDDRAISTPAAETSKPELTSRNQEKPLQPSVYVDKDFSLDPSKFGRQQTSKLKLPSQPVDYVPQGTPHLAAEKIFDVNAKILFHVLFGDKSTVWQQLQLQRLVQDIKQGPWTNLQSGPKMRNFEYRAEAPDLFGNHQLIDVSDYQIVDVLNEHLCYVVTNKRTPWYLPFRRNFRLVSKIVITHVAKSRCKLAIFTKVEWLRRPYVVHTIIEHRALKDLEEDSLDLIDLAAEQIRRLGTQSQSKAAISMFGHLGRQTEVVKLGGDSSALNPDRRRHAKSSGLLPLLLETSVSLLVSAVSALVIGLWGVLRWTVKKANMNRLIVLVLVSSLAFNSFYSYRLTGEMWNEKKAGDFMNRLGVGPSGGLTKAVYINDLDEAIAPVPEMELQNSSSCYSLFHENFSIASGDIMPPSTSVIRDSTTAKTAAYRFQRTRQRLATYRHDLLVALRLVNRVEKDIIQAEWERWVLQESRRCEMLGNLLNEQTGAGSDDHQTDDASSSSNFGNISGRADIEQWYKEYCLSCQQEQKRITNFE